MTDAWARSMQGRSVLRWGALPNERFRTASDIMLHTAGLAKASYYIGPILPALQAQATGHTQLQMAARGAQRASPALPTSQASGALPSWALPSELEPNLGQRPALPACRPPCSTPCVAARLKRPGQPRTLFRPAAARPERPGQPYAALSRRCLPASLRCTYDFRLAMGASSSSDITHATPSDTKYACAGAATSSH